MPHLRWARGGGEESQAPCLTADELAFSAVAQPSTSTSPHPPNPEFERVTHGGYGHAPCPGRGEGLQP